MDENYLHDTMNRSNKLYSMISIDNDALEILYDHKRLNVNVNDRILRVMVEKKVSITQVSQ